MQIVRRIAGGFSAALLAGSLIVAPDVGATRADQGPNFTTHMFGRMEVPAVHTPGVGWSTWQVEGDAMYFRMVVSRTEGGIAAAHLHQAPEGENGPVVAGLDISSVTTLDGGSAKVFTGLIRPDDFAAGLEGQSMDALISAIEHGTIYINVHTSAHPSGELRGQLS